MPPQILAGALTTKEYKMNNPTLAPKDPETAKGPGVGMTKQCVHIRPTTNAVVYPITLFLVCLAKVVQMGFRMI